MKTFSYTKSQFLIQQLEKIEGQRKELLTVPLSPTDQIVYRFKAIVDRIYYSLLLSGTNVERSQVAQVLDPLSGIKTSGTGQEILGFKRALDKIGFNWLVNPNSITASTITDLYQTVYKSKPQVDVDELQSSQRYIQANPDNPVVQAALAQILILNNNFFGKETTQIADLTSLLYLYKYGYDFRGMLVVEEYLYRYKDQYHRLIAQTLRETNVTPWIEFVVESTQEQLSKLIQKVTTKDYEIEENTFNLELNDRQKAILGMLDVPGSKISNKLVQKQFRISPITAARDLAKLSSLGLLFPIGKGRSTYYTKV